MTPGQGEIVCENCRFWIRSDIDAFQGQCRRRAPLPAQDTQIDRIIAAIKDEDLSEAMEGSAEGDEFHRRVGWAYTAPDEWCGEFEAKPATPPGSPAEPPGKPSQGQ